MCTQIGANIYSTGKLITFYIWSYIGRILKVEKEFEFSLLLKNMQNTQFTVSLSGYSDLTVLKEIFYQEEYDIKKHLEPKIILDLGSNIGLSAIFFHLKYPNAQILCFEPDRSAFRRLCKNISSYENIQCYNFAISDKTCEKTFYSNKSSSMSSSLTQRDNNTAYVVKCLSLEDLFCRFQIDKADIVKFDIEGEEFKVFTPKSIDKISLLIGEIHEDIANKKINEFLKKFQVHDVSITRLKKNRYLVNLWK